MSIFLTDSEREQIFGKIQNPEYSNLFWGMLNRVQKYSDSPGQINFDTNTDWWHHATEYITEAAWVCNVKPNDTLKSWLRGVTLDLVRRTDYDWIGPFFRDHQSQPPKGHLETTHLSIAVAITLDLCKDIFSADEIEEIKSKLKNTAIPQCRNWLESNRHLANWRCILLAGVAVPAAVLDDKETLDYVLEEYKFCLNAVQPDGSYAESLQYSNYCYFGLMFTYESLVRNNPELKNDISIEPYAKAIKWFIHSYFYNKPISGWGSYPMPRSANFNDSAAIFGADPDLLMHISARVKDSMPEEAALAKWMFDELYTEYPAQGPFDRNTFGFVNRYSFFSMTFYPQAADSKTPDEVNLPLTAYYSNGDYLSRNSWENGKTILAFKGGADGLHGPGHLHNDLNSFILVHNKERMLADPGHTCYRTFVHEYECTSKAHNTCTFTAQVGSELQENVLKTKLIEQSICESRKFTDSKQLDPPVERAAKKLIAERVDDVTVFGSDAADSYGAPIEKFERFAVLCGEHAVFVIDRIEASSPVTTKWNWLLNNRDEQLEYKLVYPDRMVARRGNAGMKLFHVGEASLSGPIYGHIHDAYHPLPQQPGEGAPGSGLHFMWQAAEAKTAEQRVHAIALDSYGPVAAWHLLNEDDGSCSLEGGNEVWNLKVDENEFVITEKKSNRSYTIAQTNGKWSISK